MDNKDIAVIDDTVMLFLDKCPHNVGLGDLKTWMKIDYFDPESDLHYK